MADPKKMDVKASDVKSSDEVITINLQPFLMPGAIVLSSIILGVSLFAGMNTIAGKLSGTSNTNTGTVNPTTATAGNGTGGDSTVDLLGIANDLGLNQNDFSTCTSSNKFADSVKEDTAEGTTAGINGTPGFVIGKINGDTVEGYLVSGALPFDVFQNMVDGINNNDQAKIKTVKDTYGDYVVDNVKTTISDNPILGDKSKAKAAIVEYTDLVCPFCQRHHKEVYPQIVSDLVNTNKIIYIVKDFPLSIHEPDASVRANASECVRSLGGDTKFYEFMDKVFNAF